LKLPERTGQWGKACASHRICICICYADYCASDHGSNKRLMYG